jgi:hypothetical protein
MIRAWYPSVITDPETDIKRWEKKPPPVEQVRPSHCSRCHVASRPPGGALRVVGHGVKPRQLQGPLVAGERPRQVEVFVRRFLCRSCHRTMTVGPRQMRAQRRYSASALLLALALWGLCGLSAGAIRKEVSPWQVPADVTGWGSLARWAKQGVAGKLWPLPGVPLGEAGSLREQVARLVYQLVAPEPGEDPRHFAHRAFAVGAGRG